MKNAEMHYKIMQMKKFFQNINLVNLAQRMFFLNAGIWLILTAANLSRLTKTIPIVRITGIVVVVLMLGNALVMLGCGLVLGTQKNVYYYFALAFLTINILLTFTDQFGFYDLFTLIIDVVLFGILIKVRKKYIN